MLQKIKSKVKKVFKIGSTISTVVDQVDVDLDFDHDELIEILRPTALYSLLSTLISFWVPKKILQFIWQSPLGIILDDPLDVIDLAKDVRNGYKTVKSLVKFPSKSRAEKCLWIFGFYLGLVRIFVLQVYTAEIDRIRSSSVVFGDVDGDGDDLDLDDDIDGGIVRVSATWHMGNLLGLVFGLLGVTSVLQNSTSRSPVANFLLQMDMISFGIAFLTCFFEAENGGSFFTHSTTFLLGMGSSLLFTQLISSKFFPNLAQKEKGKAVKEGRVVGRFFGALLNLAISMFIAHQFQFGLYLIGTFFAAFGLIFVSNFEENVKQRQEPPEEENSRSQIDRSIVSQMIRHRIGMSKD